MPGRMLNNELFAFLQCYVSSPKCYENYIPC